MQIFLQKKIHTPLKCSVVPVKFPVVPVKFPISTFLASAIHGGSIPLQPKQRTISDALLSPFLYPQSLADYCPFPVLPSVLQCMLNVCSMYAQYMLNVCSLQHHYSHSTLRPHFLTSFEHLAHIMPYIVRQSPLYWLVMPFSFAFIRLI